MAKTYKRNYSTLSSQNSKIIFKQWDEYTSGFENDETVMRSQSLSEENSQIIAWSSDSECNSDNESTRDISRIHRMQNHRVITRLNFDDCVSRQCEVPNKKRAKISRSVLKTNLFKNKCTLETNCKNDLMQNCKVSRKPFFAKKMYENSPMNVNDESCDSLLAAEKNVTSIEQKESVDTYPKAGVDLASQSCLVHETSLVEIKSYQLEGGLYSTNCTPTKLFQQNNYSEFSKLGRKYVSPDSPILCKTQVVEQIEKSPIIESKKYKKIIHSPVLETYSVKKGRKLGMKTNVHPFVTDTSNPNQKISHNPFSFKKSDLCEILPTEKHPDRMEEKLILECINNSEINSELYFQPCNKDVKFTPTSPIIDTKNKRIKRNKSKKKYRGQKNCLGPDSEVNVIKKDKTSSNIISIDISKYCEENNLLDVRHSVLANNCNKSKDNLSFRKLDLSFENCFINADSSLINIETDSQNMERDNISFSQTSNTSSITQNFVCIEAMKEYVSQDDVCRISNCESEISDNETSIHIGKNNTPENSVEKHSKSGEKTFIFKIYEKSSSIVNSVKSPNDSLTECIETISSQEYINQNNEKIDEDMSTSASISQSSKSSMDVCCKEYGIITVDSSSPQRQEHVFSAPAMNLDSPRRKKRLKKDGLASRLNKLLARKLSMSRMLNHEISKQDSNHKIRKTKCLLCTVIFTWTEFNRVLIYCQLKLPTESDETVSLCQVETQRWNGTLQNTVGESSKINFVLILSMGMYCSGQIKQGAVIKIFPPWQTFISTKQNLSVIFDITHIEIVSNGPLLKYSYKNAKKCNQMSECEQTFSCQCDSDFDPTCQFKLSSNILKMFFCIQPSSEQPTNMLCSLKDVGEKCDGSVVQAVKKNMFLPYADITLVLTILKIFNYREQTSKNSGYVEVWSILGKDRAGEYCEVILGSSPDIPSEAKEFKTTKWENRILNDAVGNIYRFSGFTLINRKHRNKVPEIWSLLQNTKIIKGTCNGVADVSVITQNVNHMFLYIFAPLTDTWNCECVKRVSSCRESLGNLASSIQEINDAEIHRFSTFVKLLHISTIYLYVSDLSHSDENVTYSMILIHPLCVLPNEIWKKETDILVLVDGIVFKGQLTTDKYTRIYSVISNAEVQIISPSVEASNGVKQETNKVERIVGAITNSSNEHDLVFVEGTVTGVDEETAFAWPACSTCSNDRFCELDDGTLFCYFCDQKTEIFNKMSLEIFVCCKDVSLNTSVKIKLLQKTISYLLPPKSNSQGYEMSSVLGKKIKLPLCLVVTIKNEESSKSILLEEI